MNKPLLITKNEYYTYRYFIKSCIRLLFRSYFCKHTVPVEHEGLHEIAGWRSRIGFLMTWRSSMMSITNPSRRDGTFAEIRAVPNLGCSVGTLCFFEQALS